MHPLDHQNSMARGANLLSCVRAEHGFADVGIQIRLLTATTILLAGKMVASIGLSCIADDIHNYDLTVSKSVLYTSGYTPAPPLTHLSRLPILDYLSQTGLALVWQLSYFTSWQIWSIPEGITLLPALAAHTIQDWPDMQAKQAQAAGMIIICHYNELFCIALIIAQDHPNFLGPGSTSASYDEPRVQAPRLIDILVAPGCILALQCCPWVISISTPLKLIQEQHFFFFFGWQITNWGLSCHVSHR